MSLDNVKLHLIESLDDVEQFIQWMRDKQDLPIAVDTESTGFFWHGSDHIRLAQIGDDIHGWAMDWSRWAGLFASAIALHSGPIDMMNAPFDWSFLAKEGVKLDRRRTRDVGVMSHVLEPHMSRALKNQSSRHIDPRAAAGQDELQKAFHESGWNWATVPIDFPGYWSYAALDTVLTSRLSEHHRQRISEQDSYAAYDLENAVQWVMRDCAAYGAHIDLEYVSKNYAKFTTYCDAVEKWCVAEYGIKPGSNQAVIRILSEAGFEFSKATKSGAIALDADVLRGISHPLAIQVLQRRQLQKLASTYLKFYIENADSNSLIHPSINCLGARTSRMSMDHPNLQNLPLASENNHGARVIRNCICARPGHTLLMCDQDQIEMRGLAIQSKDRGLIAAFHTDEDFFVNLARSIYQDGSIIKSDPRRRVTKNVGYAKIYGAGLQKMSLMSGVPIEQIKFTDDGFNNFFPGVREFQNQIFNEAMERKISEGVAYTVCPLTNRRHYADPGKEYALVNYRIQGWAAAFFKTKLLELDAAGLGQYLIAAVHDEVILDVPNEDVRDAVHTLRNIMNDNKTYPVPISASVSYGQRWGEKKEWSDEAI
jgi:DNA polymerase-1